MNDPMWLWDHLREVANAPELVGGFVGYFLHEIHHTIFRRPGRLLMRLFKLSRKTAAKP